MLALTSLLVQVGNFELEFCANWKPYFCMRKPGDVPLVGCVQILKTMTAQSD